MHTATQTLRLFRVLRDGEDVQAPSGAFYCDAKVETYVTARELEVSDLADFSPADRDEALAELAAIGCILVGEEIVEASDYAPAATQEAA